MKTLLEISNQETRIYRLLWQTSTSMIKQADPATGGNLMLCHNWGNAEARLFLEKHNDRQSKLFNIFRKFYSESFKAAYPTHLRNRK